MSTASTATGCRGRARQCARELSGARTSVEDAQPLWPPGRPPFGEHPPEERLVAAGVGEPRERAVPSRCDTVVAPRQLRCTQPPAVNGYPPGPEPTREDRDRVSIVKSDAWRVGLGGGVHRDGTAETCAAIPAHHRTFVGVHFRSLRQLLTGAMIGRATPSHIGRVALSNSPDRPRHVSFFWTIGANHGVARLRRWRGQRPLLATTPGVGRVQTPTDLPRRVRSRGPTSRSRPGCAHGVSA